MSVAGWRYPTPRTVAGGVFRTDAGAAAAALVKEKKWKNEWIFFFFT